SEEFPRAEDRDHHHRQGLSSSWGYSLALESIRATDHRGERHSDGSLCQPPPHGCPCKRDGPSRVQRVSRIAAPAARKHIAGTVNSRDGAGLGHQTVELLLAETAAT